MPGWERQFLQSIIRKKHGRLRIVSIYHLRRVRKDCRMNSIVTIPGHEHIKHRRQLSNCLRRPPVQANLAFTLYGGIYQRDVRPS